MRAVSTSSLSFALFVSARKGQHGAERRGWYLDAETAVLPFLMEAEEEGDE
jgi:hypothetical protein